MALLHDRHPALRYLVVGDGPERAALERLASELGLADRVELAGQLPHPEALRRARDASLFVLPSVDEAFGVAYVEAMAGGLPAIGCRGEPGPEEIAAAGGGIRLVAAGDVGGLARAIDALVGDRAALRDLGTKARATVEAAFTWERCGRETVRAYEDALR
jgi:glycosyltransferase involved in cell wall biosynthesis